VEEFFSTTYSFNRTIPASGRLVITFGNQKATGYTGVSSA
jgi:hypothetical protein